MSGTLTSLCVFLLLLYPVKPQDDAMPLLDEFGGGFSAAGNSMSLDAVAACGGGKGGRGVDNKGATGTKKNRGGLIVGVSISMAVILLTALLFYIVRRKKMPDVVEDRDHDIGPHKATEGFKEKERIGSGGFCRVYKVIRQNPDTQVAVNRVSQHSRQGLRAFIPAVPTIGGNVTGGNVKGGDVTGGNINVGDVTGSHVTGGSVTGGDITGGDVTNGGVSRSNVTGGSVTGGNVTGGKVTGGNIKCSNIAAGNVKGGNVKGGNITGGNVKGGNATTIFHFFIS